MAFEAPENNVWYLKRSRLFEGATGETIHNCEHLFVQKVCLKKTVLFTQGDDAHLVYLIKSGSVRIVRDTSDGKQSTVALLGQGDLFGEEVIFKQTNRSANAVCITDALLCMVRGADLYGIVSREPILMFNMAKYLREQLDDALATAEDANALTVANRLLRLFERLKIEYGRPAQGGTLLDVRLTHADLASLIGSTRETVTQQMNELVRKRFLRTENRAIVLVDRPTAQ